MHTKSQWSHKSDIQWRESKRWVKKKNEYQSGLRQEMTGALKKLVKCNVWTDKPSERDEDTIK